MNGSGTAAGFKVVADNRKARFNYHLEEFFEAGIVLTGGEIKSIRDGGVSLGESYIVPHKGELFLINAHIKPYKFDTQTKEEPTRRRKLLMHKREIEKLTGRVEAKGYTIVPVKLYLKRGRAKLEIALAKGKDIGDKRETTKAREAKREAERALKVRHK
ncbi:MAG: SsrA-binding protein SmpB [Bdellovibrionales bacterium]|nr:SsrA-binding protein SmpB [Bdellovibrionales bacterium]